MATSTECLGTRLERIIQLKLDPEVTEADWMDAALPVMREAKDWLESHTPAESSEPPTKKRKTDVRKPHTSVVSCPSLQAASGGVTTVQCAPLPTSMTPFMCYVRTKCAWQKRDPDSVTDEEMEQLRDKWLQADWSTVQEYSKHAELSSDKFESAFREAMEDFLENVPDLGQCKKLRLEFDVVRSV